MNPQEAQGVIMETLEKARAMFESGPCEIAECGSFGGKRFRIPSGVIVCTECLGKVLASVQENQGRFWACRCNTLAAPCPIYRPRRYSRSTVDRASPCDKSPCHHLPECHRASVRNGVAFMDWFRARVAA